MHNSKSDKERPTAREQALTRRVFDMREVLGMRHLPPIAIGTEEEAVPLPLNVSVKLAPSLS
jgi:hypothetical protein